MKQAKVIGIGVATMDIYVKQRRMYPGGNEYNIACHVVNCGGIGAFLGVFADDKAGELLEESLVRQGVDASMSHHESGSSGYSLVELKEDGDRVFLFWNQQGVTDLHPITFNSKELEYVKSFDVCCLGRCASVSLDRIKFLAQNGVSLCYDFHATYDNEVIDAIAPHIDYAFFSCSHLNEEEKKSYLRYAVEKGCKIAIGTSGADTIYAYDGKQYYVQEPFKVKPRDALGAGDSFIAAFLTSFLSEDGVNQSERIVKSLEVAAKHAAHVVMINGSIGIYFDVDPDRIDEVINR